MAQEPVRGLDESVVKKLKARAESHGRSLEAERGGILEGEVGRLDKAKARALAARIRRRIGKRPQTDSGVLQAEDRLR